MDSELSIREIEKKLDVYHRASKFMKSSQYSRDQSVFDLLRVFESTMILGLTAVVGQNILGLKEADFVALSHAHNLQDALNTAIHWLYLECDNDESDISFRIDEAKKSDALDFLCNYADPYSVIVDGYTSYSHGICTGRVEDNRVFFDSTSESLQAFLEDVAERLNQKTESVQASLMSVMMSQEFQRSAELLRKTIDFEDGRLCYEIPNSLFQIIEEVAEKHWIATSSVPQNWEFDHFSLEDFKKCWKVLYCICSAHFIAILKSIGTINSVEDLVIVQKKHDVIKLISQNSGVDVKVVQSIVETLTFDPGLRNSDIMYQPIISINDYLVITPSLIMSNCPERNLICILQAKDDKKYFQEVNLLEREMAAELINNLPVDTVTCSGKDIGVTDIDFGIYDKSANAILISEMKWLTAADSTKEVVNRQQEINHGCSQIEKAMGVALSDPVGLAKRLFGIEPDEKPEYFCCVIAKHNVRGTNRHVPVISLASISSLFANFQLSTAFHKIRNKEYLKPIPDNAQMEYKTVSYAGYTISISALAIQKEYEVWENE